MPGNKFFNFDSVQQWGPTLKTALQPVVPVETFQRLSAAKPEFMEDAVDFFFEYSGLNHENLISDIKAWLEPLTVVAYHGSRLLSEEIDQIKREGLKTLSAADRETRLRKIFESHPNWPTVNSLFREVIKRYGSDKQLGNREGQVHATISYGGLVHGFNHYLTHGSEFDQHVVRDLLGEEGLNCLSAYSKPVLVTLSIPSDKALHAANPYAALTAEIPNRIREILKAFCYWIVYPDYSLANQKFDCGLLFYEDVPPSWIADISVIDLSASITD